MWAPDSTLNIGDTPLKYLQPPVKQGEVTNGKTRSKSDDGFLQYLEVLASYPHTWPLLVVNSGNLR
jgi:hypothetical protein